MYSSTQGFAVAVALALCAWSIQNIETFALLSRYFPQHTEYLTEEEEHLLLHAMVKKVTKILS